MAHIKKTGQISSYPIRQSKYYTEGSLDLTALLEHPDLKVVTDDSSFMDQGQWKAGYAVGIHQEILEADTLLPCTSAQKAKLNKVLHLGKNKRVTIFTDSKYTFSGVYMLMEPSGKKEGY